MNGDEQERRNKIRLVLYNFDMPQQQQQINNKQTTNNQQQTASTDSNNRQQQQTYYLPCSSSSAVCLSKSACKVSNAFFITLGLIEVQRRR